MVGNESPVAHLAVIPYARFAGRSITLDGSYSYDPDDEGERNLINSIWKFEWDFSYDGDTFKIEYSEIANHPDFDGIAENAFTAGEQRVMLKVYDVYNAIGTIERTFDVGNIIYVDVDSYPFHDGSTWERVFVDIQNALDIASSGNEIWVADGTYKPTDEDDRTISFELVEGVSIYGGFEGNSRVGGGETERSQRDWANNETILSGDIDGSGNNDSYNVVVGAAGATLDGFTITKGYADHGSTAQYKSGGGIFNYGDAMLIYNCTLKNNYALYGSAIYQMGYNCSIFDCDISNNSGVNNLFGAVYITDYTYIGESSFNGNQCGGLYISGNYARVDSCTFENNQSKYGGAIGVATTSGTTYINGCTFSNNVATDTTREKGGGALHISGTSNLVEVNRCLFYNNSCSDEHDDGGGGAVYCLNSESKFVNSLFVDNINSGGYGGAISFKNCTEAEILNCTFYGNDCDMGGAINCCRRGSSATSNVLNIRNTILWLNDATYAHEISATNYDYVSSKTLTMYINNSDLDIDDRDERQYYGDWIYTYHSDIYHTDRDNVYSDPLYDNVTDVFGEGFALTSNSPCIDEGKSLYIIGYSSDLAGNDRQCNYIVDIGAYEYCD